MIGGERGVMAYPEKSGKVPLQSFGHPEWLRLPLHQHTGNIAVTLPRHSMSPTPVE